MSAQRRTAGRRTRSWDNWPARREGGEPLREGLKTLLSPPPDQEPALPLGIGLDHEPPFGVRARVGDVRPVLAHALRPLERGVVGRAGRGVVGLGTAASGGQESGRGERCCKETCHG